MEACFQRCHHTVNTAESHIKFTLENFQRKMQKCEMDCQELIDFIVYIQYINNI